MTKKSQGRVMRDAFKNEFAKELSENKNWDELQSRYEECRNLLVMHVGVGHVLDNPEIRAEIKDTTTLANNIRILTRDLSERQEELNRIYSTHSDKIGGCTEDDIMFSFEIMEKYTHWLALVENVVQPTVALILEMTSEAEKVVMQKHAALQAQDPSNTAPIDVEFNDTPSSQQAAALADGIAQADHTNPQPE